MLGWPGFGLVDLLRDQHSECPHSGHCQLDILWGGIAGVQLTGVFNATGNEASSYSRPQHDLYFLRLPQGQG